jgi:hypothetical protein
LPQERRFEMRREPARVAQRRCEQLRAQPARSVASRSRSRTAAIAFAT